MSQIQLRSLFFCVVFLFATFAVLLNDAYATPPAGFQRIDVLGSSVTLKQPTDFAFAPDGRIFVLEKIGQVRIVLENGTLMQQPLLNITAITTSNNERGLLGIAIDPNFNTTDPYIYLFYTHANPLQTQISRFTVTGDTASPASELVLFKTNTIRKTFHQGGGLRIGPDGKLWISTGENGNWGTNTSLLHSPISLDGKILRINRDGTIPNDNPFFGSSNTSIRKEIYAWGGRNPYKFDFLPSGKVLAGDVGETTWEELNLINSGADYGWPLTTIDRPDGPCSTCGYANPIYAYHHNLSIQAWTPQNTATESAEPCPNNVQPPNSTIIPCPNSAVTAGVVYTADRYPAQYRGKYFFGDYARQEIYYMNIINNYTQVQGNHSVFDPQTAAVVAFKLGPDENLYYIAVVTTSDFANSGKLFKYRFNSANTAPVADGSANPTGGYAPLLVQFSSAGTFDPDNDPLSFAWNFGDGVTSTEENPTHTYSTNGIKIVTLNVSDGQHFDIDTFNIIVGNGAPRPFIGAPLNNSLYEIGDTIDYGGYAVDPDQGNLSSSSLEWFSVFHHGTHIHPFFPAPVSGYTGSFVIPEDEVSTDVSFELSLTATDSNGTSNKTVIFIRPKIVNLNFGTNPAGLGFSVRSAEYNTLTNFQSISGFHWDIDTQDSQSLNGTNYQFTHWTKNGVPLAGNSTSQIVSSTSNAAFTANFIPSGSQAPPLVKPIPIINISNGTFSVSNLGMFLYPRFDNNVKDSSGNGINGTQVNGANFASSQFGSAANFDGVNDYINFGNSSILNSKKITLSFWVKPNTFPSGETMLIQKQDFTNKKGYAIFTKGTVLNFRAMGAGNTGTTTFNVSQTMPLSQWTHVATTYDGSNRRIYINGKLVKTGGGGFDIDPSLVDLVLGSTKTSKFFNGQIDELMIFNRSLSQQEISLLSGTRIKNPKSTTITLSESNSNDGDVVYKLFRNNLQVSNPDTAILAAGTYAYVANTTGGLNYKSGSIMVPIFVAPSSNVTPPSPTGLPENFEKIKVIGTSGGLIFPTGMTFAPDGRLFVLEKDGRVRIIKNSNTSPNLLSTPALTLTNINSTSERGLLGIALDPNFQSNGFMYLYYTRNTPLQERVSRFTVTGDTASPASELLLWNTDAKIAVFHQAGTVRFGSDGKLYISVGENGGADELPPLSQRLDSYFGKILRINKDGTIPNDNPFFNTLGAKKEIWALGLRNPFRFNMLPNGKPIVGDVGGNLHSDNTPEELWEEVNVIEKGGNYGWPFAEGSCSGCPYVNPVFAYNHAGGEPPSFSASITGGLIYNSSAFPPEFRGSYFYGDYSQDFTRRVVLDENFGSAIADYDFDNESDNVVDFAVGPEGDLYYITLFTSGFGPGEIYRYHYTLGNHFPVVNISADPSSGYIPLSVKFWSNGTFDPDGDSLNYNWNFGDGGTSTSANPTHTYATNGTRTATLTVDDGDLIKIESLQIFVGDKPPQPKMSIGIPIDSSHPNTPSHCQSAPCYNAGDAITFIGNATDPDQGNIPASGLSWKIVFHHGTHIHPFLDFSGVSSGQFTIPDTGETASDTWYEIILTATDLAGLKNQTSKSIFPNKVQLTFNTNPSGLKISLDGITFNGIQDESVVGFVRVVSAEQFQLLSGTTYSFNSWSNGGARTQAITTPSVDTTYTANFLAQGPPVPSNVQQIPFGNSMNLSAKWIDDLRLDRAILSTDESGVWRNYTNALTVLSLNQFENTSITTVRSGSKTVAGYTVNYAQDSGSNLKINDLATIEMSLAIPKTDRYNLVFRVKTGKPSLGHKSIEERYLYFVDGVPYQGGTDAFTFGNFVNETSVTTVTWGDQIISNLLLKSGTHNITVKIIDNSTTSSHLDYLRVEINNRSPLRLQGSSDWSNFTWSNSSVPNGTSVSWRIFANDTDGNFGSTNIMTFVKGGSLPSPPAPSIPLLIQVESPQNITYFESGVWFNSTINKDANSVGVSIDGNPNSSLTNSSGNWNYFAAISDGPHDAIFYAEDSENSTVSDRIFFTVDTSSGSPPSPKTIPVMSLSNGTSSLSNSGLVLYSRFEGESGDYSGNENSGTATNGATFSSGKFGSSASFDGADDYIDFGNDGSLDLNKLTISMWVKINELPAQENMLIDKQNFATNEGYALFLSGNNLFFRVMGPGGPSPNGITFVDISSLVNLGEWTHIAATYDNVNRKIYINGKLVKTGLGGIIIDNSATNLLVGSANGGGKAFNGTIDELMIFNKSLNAAEISLLSGTVVNSGTPTSFSFSESNSNDGDVVYKLLRDGAEVSLPDSTILPAGDYAYIANTTGGTSYLAASFMIPLIVKP